MWQKGDRWRLDPCVRQERCMAAGRWMGWLAAGLMVAAPGGSSWAQSWNLYSGTTSYFIPYWKQTGSNPNTDEQATMNPNPPGAHTLLSFTTGPPPPFPPH